MAEMNILIIRETPLANEVVPTVWSGETPMYNLAASKSLIACCEKLGIGVLGIEGFIMQGPSRCPKMDYIADFSVLSSQVNFKNASIKSAVKFLELADDADGILFEFILIR